eukprot:6175342-Pleurochrysis_carterae.AAC.6
MVNRDACSTYATVLICHSLRHQHANTSLLTKSPDRCRLQKLPRRHGGVGARYQGASGGGTQRSRPSPRGTRRVARSLSKGVQCRFARRRSCWPTAKELLAVPHFYAPLLVLPASTLTCVEEHRVLLPCYAEAAAEFLIYTLGRVARPSTAVPVSHSSSSIHLFHYNSKASRLSRQRRWVKAT